MDFQWTSMDNGPWINPPGGPFLSFCKSQFFCEIRILSGTRVGSNYCPWTNQSLKWSRTFLNNWNWCTVTMSYNITIHKHNKKTTEFWQETPAATQPNQFSPLWPLCWQLGLLQKMDHMLARLGKISENLIVARVMKTPPPRMPHVFIWKTVKPGNFVEGSISNKWMFLKWWYPPSHPF